MKPSSQTHHQERCARLDAVFDSVLILVEELSQSMRGQADCERAEFERGSRAISSLLRANSQVGALKDKASQELSDQELHAQKQPLEDQDFPDLNIIKLKAVESLAALNERAGAKDLAGEGS